MGAAASVSNGLKSKMASKPSAPEAPPKPTGPNPTPNSGQFPEWWNTPGKVINIQNLQDWQQKCLFIKSTTHNTLVVVEFTAPWCGPSSFIAPLIEKQADDNKQVLFVRVNYDELEEVAAEEGVAMPPTFLLFKGGKKAGDPIVGAKREELINRINALKN